MSWARVNRGGNSFTPTYRASVTLDCVDTSNDYQIAIPADWSDFWDNVDTNGYEIFVADGDGLTALSWKWSSFTKATRTGTLQIDNYIAPVTGVAQIFLYWGGMTGAADGAASFTAASVRSGYVDLGGRVGPVAATPERPGDTKPRHVQTKAAGETIWVWLDLWSELVHRLAPSDSRVQWEEVDGVTYSVLLAGVAQGAMVSATAPRISEGRYVRVPVSGGTSGTDYTISVTIYTTIPNQASGRTLIRRVLLKVLDVSEA